MLAAFDLWTVFSHPDGFVTEALNPANAFKAAPTSADDTILYGTYPFINLGSARTSGVDVDLRMKLSTGAWGEFTTARSK